MTGRLDGKVALITGGSRGIGLEIAKTFRAEGAHLALVARKLEGLTAAREELLQCPGDGEVVIHAANAGEPDQATSVVANVVERLGPIDILVNNAGTNPYFGPLINIDLARAEKTHRVNQFGMLAWLRAASDAGMGERGGVVLNIASVGGLTTEPGIGYYNGTKAAMIHMTRQLGFELGPKIRINTIAPGVIKTEMARAVWEVREQTLAAELPMRRMGLTTDIAPAALFFCSDDSSWITGQSLVIDGGGICAPNVFEA
ncbi:SDR family oxidoreductase [Sphingopyxis sp. SCN 67-31]|uniref:SDR family oxidoreductase n=1 Tax=Sphingopyxis sp. SCN 67-31 TaxID=1660142 RepID=UPI00086DC1FC|nr:SDR family oxidoreductase [Sphingopyxis sp. SCN 67-31]ODU28370.1 MAG: 3-ketoacyl-ACP reductase [Sphingopyxis sp. SCN 67-31]